MRITTVGLLALLHVLSILTGCGDSKAEAQPADVAGHAEPAAHDHGNHDHGDQGPDAAAAEASYLINHSTVMYLMGPDGGYLTHFSHGSTSDTVAQTLIQRIGG